jgi:hypothetical protein
MNDEFLETLKGFDHSNYLPNHQLLTQKGGKYNNFALCYIQQIWSRDNINQSAKVINKEKSEPY